VSYRNVLTYLLTYLLTDIVVVVIDADEPVKITLELKNVEGFETESATLTCDLSKSDRTDGQWLFNGQPLTTSERIQLKVDGCHQTVEFAELTVADAGQYTYSIENVSTSATLTVRGTAVVPLHAPVWVRERCRITYHLVSWPFVIRSD